MKDMKHNNIGTGFLDGEKITIERVEANLKNSDVYITAMFPDGHRERVLIEYVNRLVWVVA